MYNKDLINKRSVFYEHKMGFDWGIFTLSLIKMHEHNGKSHQKPSLPEFSFELLNVDEPVSRQLNPNHNEQIDFTSATVGRVKVLALMQWNHLKASPLSKVFFLFLLGYGIDLGLGHCGLHLCIKWLGCTRGDPELGLYLGPEGLDLNTCTTLPSIS